MNPLIKLIRHPRNVMSWVHLIISPFPFTSSEMKSRNTFECPSQCVDFCIHLQFLLSVFNSKLYLFPWWMFLIVVYNLKSRHYLSYSIFSWIPCSLVDCYRRACWHWHELSHIVILLLETRCPLLSDSWSYNDKKR